MAGADSVVPTRTVRAPLLARSFDMVHLGAERVRPVLAAHQGRLVHLPYGKYDEVVEDRLTVAPTPGRPRRAAR
jgi:hypothetical protein